MLFRVIMQIKLLLQQGNQGHGQTNLSNTMRTRKLQDKGTRKARKKATDIEREAGTEAIKKGLVKTTIKATN